MQHCRALGGGTSRRTYVYARAYDLVTYSEEKGKKEVKLQSARLCLRASAAYMCVEAGRIEKRQRMRYNSMDAQTWQSGEISVRKPHERSAG